jgi:multimeric flavodoxin WrbA
VKVITLLGSPRENGNTATALDWIEETFQKSGHETERIHVGASQIRGCDESMNCQKVREEPGCDLPDGVNKIFEKMMAADLTVFATPLFCWSFTAQMKALLDRSICLCKLQKADGVNFLLEGKPLALVCTAGGPEYGNMDLITEIFTRYAEYQRAIMAGSLLIPRCTTPEALPSEVRKRTHDFVQSLLTTVG